jgi:transmembrane sensor
MAPNRLAYLFRKCIRREASPGERDEFFLLVSLPENELFVQGLVEEALASPPGQETPSGQVTASILEAIFGTQQDQQAPVAPLEAAVPSSVSLHRNGRMEGGKWKWMAAAAAFVLLSGSGLWYYYTRAAYREKPLAAGNAVKNLPPGGSRALLTLANGAVIALDSATNGNLAKQGVTGIVKQSGGELYYKGINHSAGTTGSAMQDHMAIGYNTVTTPKGGQYRLVLSDGTRVWLNAASSLHYPAAFGDRDRTVELTGEGYFEIAPETNHPFHVKIARMDITVLGTRFDIMGYRDEGAVKATLVDGAIRVSAGNHSRTLQPGDQAVLDSASGVIGVGKGDMEEALAWKNGYFLFRGVDLPVLLRQFSRWYNIDIVYEGQKRSYQFVGQIPRSARLFSALKLLEVNKIPFRYENNKLIVYP